MSGQIVLFNLISFSTRSKASVKINHDEERGVWCAGQMLGYGERVDETDRINSLSTSFSVIEGRPTRKGRR